MKEKISIITPVYNCEKLIDKTIECVIKQSYPNWELLLVDDCSTDNSTDIIEKYMKNDSRIKYFKLKENSGAAIARNYALEKASGDFVAYLDSDDLWKKDKLEKQINFMINNNYAFSCTSYEKIDENGASKNKIIKMPKRINYNAYLRNTIIQTVGVMVNLNIIDKKLLIMPNIRRRQDAATWCQILKEGYDCYGMDEALAYYRVVSNSLSSNKIKAMKGTWFLYRKIEKLSLVKSIFCFEGYALNACKKRIYLKNPMKKNFKGGEMILKKGFYKMISKISDKSPEMASKIYYYLRMKKKLNLNEPKDFNEKLMWMKLNEYPNNMLISDCADKYKVRKYVENMGCGEILNDLIAVYNSVEEINFEKLPEKFVLKCNHGSGYNIICDDIKKLNIEKTKKQLKEWMNTDYWKIKAEVQYKPIEKKIICEKYLESKNEKPIEDYKIYCFNGKAKLCMVCLERNNGKAKYYFMDKSWNILKINQEGIEANDSKIISKPKNINDMYRYAEILAKPFKFVRVDFYDYKGKIVFGELTFTPCACADKDYTNEALIKLGDMIDLKSEK